jgi:hypothetical protein
MLLRHHTEMEAQKVDKERFVLQTSNENMKEQEPRRKSETRGRVADTSELARPRRELEIFGGAQLWNPTTIYKSTTSPRTFSKPFRLTNERFDICIPPKYKSDSVP